MNNTIIECFRRLIMKTNDEQTQNFRFKVKSM